MEGDERRVKGSESPAAKDRGALGPGPARRGEMKEGEDGNAGPSSGAEDGVATETEGGEERREREAGGRRLRATHTRTHARGWRPAWRSRRAAVRGWLPGRSRAPLWGNRGQQGRKTQRRKLTHAGTRQGGGSWVWGLAGLRALPLPQPQFPLLGNASGAPHPRGPPGSPMTTPDRGLAQ